MCEQLAFSPGTPSTLGAYYVIGLGSILPVPRLNKHHVHHLCLVSVVSFKQLKWLKVGVYSVRPLKRTPS